MTNEQQFKKNLPLMKQNGHLTDQKLALVTSM